MFCGNCGKKNEEGARFCEFCGAFLAENPDGQRAASNRHENSEAPGMVFAEESEKQNLRRQQNVQEPPRKKKKWIFFVFRDRGSDYRPGYCRDFDVPEQTGETAL